MTSKGSERSKSAPSQDMSKFSMSPSRASSFKMCGQLYKFKNVLKIPDVTGPAAMAGTLVHQVLEELMMEEPVDRTEAKADDLLLELYASRVGSEWEELTEADVKNCARYLRNYFEMEDPSQVNVVKTEWFTNCEVGNDVVIRGIIDRLDATPQGIRLTDYKTGRTPSDGWELKAFFALRFYSLMVLRNMGEVPHEIRLMYLDSKTWLTLEPDERGLLQFEKQIVAIATAMKSGKFSPKPGKICDWCSYVFICPAWNDGKDVLAGMEEGRL